MCFHLNELFQHHKYFFPANMLQRLMVNLNPRSAKTIASLYNKAKGQFKDNKSSFKQLLEKDYSVGIHQKNLQVLVTEIFKVKNSLAPDVMKDVFELKETPYNLRSESNHFTRRNVKTFSYGLLSIKHLAPQI